MRDGRTKRSRSGRSRGLSIALLACCALLGLTASVVRAQTEIDVEPPLVGHEPIESGVAGVSQEFTATVVDDRELAEVSLFHRFAGEEAFDETVMARIASSSVFTATIPTRAGDTRAIEYYIQARDEAGNRVIKGYAFSPLIRRMGERTDAGVADTDTVPSSGGSGRRWLYIGLGVLAVGALAAAARDDGSSSSTPSNTFTVTLDPPG